MSSVADHGDSATVFWQRRYDAQHRKVHAMEDEIARLRSALEKIAATEAAFLRDGPEWVHWREQARRALNA